MSLENQKNVETKSEQAASGSNVLNRGLAKSRQGVVVSNKMDKTAVVTVTRQVKHPKYGKYVKSTSKYMVDDSKNACQIGDIVEIAETKPISRHKHWKLVKIVRQAAR